jgi:EmrB/QacA subfamily drug resistance transporter
MTNSDEDNVQNPRWVLAAAILASSLAFVDGSVVNVGLPAIDADFRANASDLQWVVNAYLLPLSALLLLGGAAGDRLGRTRLLVSGTALFGLASIVCAFAPDLFWLLAGRVAQGVGSAMLMPNSLSILGTAFSGVARGRAIGIWAAAGAAMAAFGPVLGGGLIDVMGWRTIFLINLPLALGAIAITVIFIKETRREAGAPALDSLGGFLATGALGLLTWGLTVGSGISGWTTTAYLLCAGGFLLALGFLAVENTRGDHAMMPLALFSSSDFVGLTTLTLLLYGALGALLVLLPYVLIRADGYSGTEAGGALFPFAVVLALASPVMGSLAGRIGSRIPLTVGPLIVAGGFLIALRIGLQANYWTDVLPCILVMAIGMAGAVAPLTNAVLASVDHHHTGAASGLNSAVARTGGLVATALLGGALGTSGSILINGFHVTMVACAAASLGAAASAFFLISPPRPPNSSIP